MFEPSALSTHNWEKKSASSRRNKALTVSRFTQRIKQLILVFQLQCLQKALHFEPYLAYFQLSLSPSTNAHVHLHFQVCLYSTHKIGHVCFIQCGKKQGVDWLFNLWQRNWLKELLKIGLLKKTPRFLKNHMIFQKCPCLQVGICIISFKSKFWCSFYLKNLLADNLILS